ncbi:hypothetical protein [Terasakiella sp.]|uniref:hypothetical protein n=1 Tax=Terasakiella sp. TaxID=2034861 RepID=UPI003AA9DDED
MSFLHNLHQRLEILEMNDISDLCVLGFLFDDARNLNGLLAAIRMLDIPTWQPTIEVIETTLERLLDNACVVKLEAGNEVYFSITGIGIRTFFSLMKRPMPNNQRMRDTTLSLKSTFVENLPQTICAKVVEELIGFYNCQLNCLENQCTNCPLKSQRAQIKTDRQLFHIQQELEWLGRMTQNLSLPQAYHFHSVS